MSTIRQGLTDSINDLNQLILVAPSEEARNQLRQQRANQFKLLDQVFASQIDANTAEFTTAIEALEEASEALAEAKADIEKIAQAIATAVKVATAVDKVLKAAAEAVG